MGALLLGLDRILYLINRCRIYEILYLRTSEPMEGLDHLRSALVILYAIILQFLSKAIRQFGKSTPSRAFHAFSCTDDIAAFEKKSQAQEEQVEIAAESCERFNTRSARAEWVRNVGELKHMLADLKEQNNLFSHIETRVTGLWTRSSEDERSEILCWTSDIPYQDHHLLACTGRTAGTAEWLLHHSQYRKWKSSKEPMILWLHGIRKLSL
jgi:hypothetical protein